MKIESTEQIIFEYLTEKFKGKRIRVWFAEYGRETSYKYISAAVNIATDPTWKQQRINWQFKNVVEFQPEVSSISPTTVKNWYLVKFTQPINYAGCEIKDMIVENQFIDVIE